MGLVFYYPQRAILNQRNIAKPFKTVFFLYWTGFTLKGTMFLCMTMHQSIHLMKRGSEWKISASEWPPQSPDLCIIENVWWMMKVKLYEDAGSITTRAELVQRLQLLWRDITTDKHQELYSSLPSRMAPAIKCKSTITKY